MPLLNLARLAQTLKEWQGALPDPRAYLANGPVGANDGNSSPVDNGSIAARLRGNMALRAPC